MDRDTIVNSHTFNLYILSVNALIDQGEKEEIENIKQEILNGDVFEYLSEKYHPDFEYTGRTVLNELLIDKVNTYDGSENRKFGINNNGLNLLIAYLNEIIMNQNFK